MCFFLYTLCSLMALRLYSSPCAFLQGVDRAFPYVSTDEVGVIIESQTPVLFKLVTSKAFHHICFVSLVTTKRMIKKMVYLMYAGTFKEFQRGSSITDAS